MENKNPKTVIDAIIESPKKFGKIEIGPISILKYAYLEKIHSPFIDSAKEFSVDNIIPTVFVLASDKKVLRKYGGDVETMKMDALEWADENLSIDDVPAIIKDIVDRFAEINKAAPSGGANSKKK